MTEPVESAICLFSSENSDANVIESPFPRRTIYVGAILTREVTEGGVAGWNSSLKDTACLAGAGPGVCQPALDLAAYLSHRELAALVCRLATTVEPSDLFPVFSFTEPRVCSPWMVQDW